MAAVVEDDAFERETCQPYEYRVMVEEVVAVAVGFNLSREI